jgi:hypothetical protein
MTPIRPGTELQGTALSVILEDLRRAHNAKVLQRNTVEMRMRLLFGSGKFINKIIDTYRIPYSKCLRNSGHSR